MVSIGVALLLESDFFDFAKFPELVVLDPFGFASFLQQTRCVEGPGDAAMAAEQLAVQPTSDKHAHDGSLRCDEARNENGGPRHSQMNVLGGCDILKLGMLPMLPMLLVMPRVS